MVVVLANAIVVIGVVVTDERSGRRIRSAVSNTDVHMKGVAALTSLSDSSDRILIEECVKVRPLRIVGAILIFNDL